VSDLVDDDAPRHDPTRSLSNETLKSTLNRTLVPRTSIDRPDDRRSLSILLLL